MHRFLGNSHNDECPGYLLGATLEAFTRQADEFLDSGVGDRIGIRLALSNFHPCEY